MENNGSTREARDLARDKEQVVRLLNSLRTIYNQNFLVRHIGEEYTLLEVFGSEGVEIFRSLDLGPIISYLQACIKQEQNRVRGENNSDDSLVH